MEIYLDQIIEKNFESICPDLDQAFKQFYTSSQKDKYEIIPIEKKYLPQLQDIGLDYIKSHLDLETTRKYLKNLRIIWVVLAQQNKLLEAKQFLIRIIREIKLYEQKKGIAIHKGPIYYFWGGTSILLGQLDEGFVMMHTAYTEDRKNNVTQPSSAYKFVSLNFGINDFRFHEFIKVYADFLQSFLTIYNRLSITPKLDLDSFRTNFLDSNSDPDIVFSFTHSLARIYQLVNYPDYALISSFSGQYELNILFDLILVIENAIRNKHPDRCTNELLFPELAEFLSASLKWNIKSGHFTGYINPEVKKDYDNCLENLLDRKFKFTHTVINRDLESDISIAYLLRNRGAHNISSSKVIINRFNEVLQSLFNILFLTVKTLY
jgi:hypothetical protein